jgi:hypothetical protein
MSVRMVTQLALFGAAAALVWQLQQMPSDPVDVAPISPRSEAALSGIPVPQEPPRLLLLPPLDTLSATLEQPFFASSRRPASPIVTGSDSRAEPAVTLELLGTLTLPGGARALLRVKDTAAGTWLAKGETTSGWTVASIAKDRVVVKASGRRVELTFFPTKVPPAAQGSTPVVP